MSYFIFALLWSRWDALSLLLFLFSDLSMSHERLLSTLPCPARHIRFYCVLLHTCELSVYLLCRYVILGEEHGYSPHTDILKHWNSSRIINKTPLQSSIALHSTQNATHHTTPHDCTHFNTHHTHTAHYTHSTAHALSTRLACSLKGLSTKHAFPS